MFELRTTTKVKVLNIGTLVQKDRKADELPGAQLTLQMLLQPSAMAMFDGRWPDFLSQKATTSDQGKLEGMEGTELTTLAQHVKRVPLDYKQTGCQVIIDRGIGRKNSNIELDDATVHSVSFQPQQSGGVKLTAFRPAWTPHKHRLSRHRMWMLKSSQISARCWTRPIAFRPHHRKGSETSTTPCLCWMRSKPTAARKRHDKSSVRGRGLQVPESAAS